MKYLWTLAFSLTFSALGAQELESFENFGLAVDSFENGSSMIEGFDASPFFLPNDYDTAFGGFWDGWSLSAMRNDSTSGIANQYSAIPGDGSTGGVYAVGYPDFVEGLSIAITGYLDASIALTSLDITNSAYTYYSMLEGDQFAKKFGGASGDDPDYFKVSLNLEGEFVDTTKVETFYLADYRGDTNDYIVDDWRTVDLSSFDPVVEDTVWLRLKFESSDSAFGFINTPTYVCIDDIHYSVLYGVSENQLSGLSIQNRGGVLEIDSESSGDLFLYSLQGALVERRSIPSGLSQYALTNLSEGIYLVFVSNGSASISAKIYIH